MKLPSMFRNIVITLDGPAASGKSTTARLVAESLGWLYLDTGAMYRAIAVKAVRMGLSVDDTHSIGEMAKNTHIRLTQGESGMRVFMDDEEVTGYIRSPEIDKAVGPVCEVPAVRKEMIRLQREIAGYGHLVTDGRDMGTVVFPKADLKYFMTASIVARTRRRQLERKMQGLRMTLKEIRTDIEKRDERDSSRNQSPLRRADDAVCVDTSDMSIEKQVDLVQRNALALIHQLPLYRTAQNRFYKVSIFLLIPLFKMLFGLKVNNRTRFPARGAVIVAPNHVSNLDPVIVGISCPREVFFFAKEELFKVPGLSFIIRALNAFPVKRDIGDRGAIRTAFDVLKSNHPLMLFPEGTRSKTGKLQAAKTGIGMIASQNCIDIVPVAVDGTFHAMRHLWQRRVCVTFGEPIEISRILKSPLPKKELYREIGELTLKRIGELKHDCQY